MHQHTLQKCLTAIWPELIKRYGEEPGEYTRPQIKATIAALGIDDQMLPYLYATFLSEEEYKLAQGEMPAADWVQLEKDAQAAYDAIQHTQSPSAHFYESWTGAHGL
jgi:hypothetical protein